MHACTHACAYSPLPLLVVPKLLALGNDKIEEDVIGEVMGIDLDGDGEVDEVMAGRGLMVVVYRHLAWIANGSVDWRVQWDS